MAAAAAAAAKAAAAAISAGAAVALCSERAHAEGGTPTFRFPGFSTPAPAPAAPPPHQQPPAPAGGRGEEAAEEAPRVSTQHPRTSAAGFDPAPLERGVEALNKLKQAPDPKKVGFLGCSCYSFLFRGRILT